MVSVSSSLRKRSQCWASALKAWVPPIRARRLGGHRAGHEIGEQAAQVRHRHRRAQAAERLHRGQLEPGIRIEEAQEVGNGAGVAQLADRHDRLLHHVGIGVVQHAAQRLEGPRVAQVGEHDHRLQHHVRVVVLEQSQGQREAAVAPHLEHLDPGVAQHVVGVAAQVGLDPLVGDGRGAHAQRPATDARAGIADQALDGVDPLFERHRGEVVEQLDTFLPGGIERLRC